MQKMQNAQVTKSLGDTPTANDDQHTESADGNSKETSLNNNGTDLLRTSNKLHL